MYLEKIFILVFFSGVTDHLPIFQITNLSVSPNHKTSPYLYINQSDPSSLNSFQRDLSVVDWNDFFFFLRCR